MKRLHVLRDERGVSLIEMLVATILFAILFLMIDGVFISARRSASKTELGTDVAQNARIALERLTREIRESGATGSPSAIIVGGSAGAMAVVFKSARPESDSGVFCVNVTSTAEELYESACNYFGGPPASGIATYGPVWQRYVGYYVAAATGGGYNLVRVTANLTAPSDALPAPTSLSGGTTIATFVESFDVSWGSGRFGVTLRGAGTVVTQGSAVPTQRIDLQDTVLVRN